MNSPASTQLLLSVRDAAKALAISEKTLWSYSKPRGPIPTVRLGGRVLYSPDALRAFIVEMERQAAKSEVNA